MSIRKGSGLGETAVVLKLVAKGPEKRMLKGPEKRMLKGPEKRMLKGPSRLQAG